MSITPPSAVLDVAGPADGWEPVDSTTDRPARSWLTDRYAIEAQPIGRRHVLEAASDNSTWLGEHVTTASPVLRVDEGERAWLVSERLPGVPSHRPDLHGDVGSLAEVAGKALRALHALPLAAAPVSIERGWDALEAMVAANVAAGLGEVDEPYQRYSGDELLALWRQGRPSSDDLVICHGRASLSKMMAHQGSFTGFVGLGGVRIADRHLDLAHAHASIHRHLGPEAVYVFYDTYGQDPELLRLDHYLLAKQLMP